MASRPAWAVLTPFLRAMYSAWGRSKSSPRWMMLPPRWPPNATATLRQQTGKAGLPATKRLHPQHKHQAGTRVRSARPFPGPARCRKAGLHRQRRRPHRAVGERRRPLRLLQLPLLPNRRRLAGDHRCLPQRRRLQTGLPRPRHRRPTPADLLHGVPPHKRRSRLRPTGQARLRPRHRLPQTTSGASSRNPMWSIGREAALAARRNRLRLPSHHRLLRLLPLRCLLRHPHRLRQHRQRR